MKEKQKGRVKLSLDDWRKVINQVQRLGVSTISLTGGEPLESPDVMEIIKSVNHDFSQVIMFTSGYLLEEKAEELAKSGLTSVIVSLNSADAAQHDKTKNFPGIYEKVLRGIKAAQKAKLLVGIAAVIYKDDLANGNVVSLIEQAKKLKANQIIFFDAIPAGCYSENTDVVWSDEDVDELIKLCSKYHEKKNYPGVLPYSFLNSYRSIGCYAGTVYFYISPYGDACPCDFCSFSVGNVKEESVFAAWDKFREHKEFVSSSLSGCKMKNKEFREKFMNFGSQGTPAQ
jgi:MoaA/NifB/PqqE/SkfB family radical SAM enzyme